MARSQESRDVDKIALMLERLHLDPQVMTYHIVHGMHPATQRRLFDIIKRLIIAWAEQYDFGQAFDDDHYNMLTEARRLADSMLLYSQQPKSRGKARR